MHVDRATFLWLTASIAAGSCAPASEPKAPAADVASPSAPIVDVGPSPGDSASDDADPATAEGAYLTMGEPGEPGEPVDTLAPARAVAPSALASECRSLRAPPGPHCESFHSTPSECEIYDQALEREAAKRATACLVSKSGTQGICKFGVTADCFVVGIRAARTKSGARQVCASVMARCGQRYREPDLSMASCVSAVSAVRDHLRPQLVSCMSEGCGVGNCLYALESP